MDISNGYDPKKHARLKRTIAKPGVLGGGPPRLRLMACHETEVGQEVPCVGWLANQLGPGNNILLRLAVRAGRVNAIFDLVGDQHERFEDTIPGRKT